MASNQSQSLFQCNSCHNELNLESKTLPCLHSFCNSCLNRHFEQKTNKNGQCPECNEPLLIDQLSLSPFLVKSLKCRQLESGVLKCDLCSEDGNKSTARSWCNECQKIFCGNCNRFHKKLQVKHNAIDLYGLERGEVIKAVMADMCSLHQKAKDLYCKQCNMCFCDGCYQNHLTESPRCSPKGLSVRKESLKQKSRGPILAKQIEEFDTSLRSVNERARNYTEKLSSDCKSRCEQLWQDFEEMMKNARQKTEDLCEEIREKTNEQITQWQQILEKNDKILKQLEIWRINLHHLLSDAQHDVDVVCSLQSLGAKLSYQLNKPIEKETYKLDVTFSNRWLQFLPEIRSQRIGSVSLKLVKMPTEHLQFEKQWKLRGWNSNISSINVSDEDGHIFLCDYSNTSVIEFTEEGEFVSECVLCEGMKPRDMCAVPPYTFVVCGEVKRLVFLQRCTTYTKGLSIMKTITTEKLYCSLCLLNETIFACDMNFQLDSFTKEGDKIKTIRTGELWVQFSLPLIRANPSARNCLGTRIDSSEISRISVEGRKDDFVKTEEEITDFYVNEFGHIYLCNFEGIFPSSGKYLCKFEKKCEELPRIFVLQNKIFVSVKIDGEYFIKIFKVKK